MKRSGPLKRKTKLKPGKPLKRTVWIKHTTIERGKAITRKKTKHLTEYERELDAITPALYLRAGGKCEMRVPGICTEPNVWRYERCHRKPRTGRPGDGTNTLENLLLGCLHCHTWATHHPKEALDLGLRLLRTDDPNEHPYVSPRRLSA